MAVTRKRDYDPERCRVTLERIVTMQNSLRTRDLSKAVTAACGKHSGVRVFEEDNVVYLVVRHGEKTDYAETVAALNVLGLGHTALMAIREVCAHCPEGKPCIVELFRRDDTRTDMEWIE